VCIVGGGLQTGRDLHAQCGSIARRIGPGGPGCADRLGGATTGVDEDVHLLDGVGDTISD
jgi:hypothetical protein